MGDKVFQAYQSQENVTYQQRTGSSRIKKQFRMPDVHQTLAPISTSQSSPSPTRPASTTSSSQYPNLAIIFILTLLLLRILLRHLPLRRVCPARLAHVNLLTTFRILNMPSLGLMVSGIAKHVCIIVTITPTVRLVSCAVVELQVCVNVLASWVRPEDLGLCAA
jgi:hypothetical protein